MRLKVITVGDRTEVVDAATGEPIDRIKSIKFEHDAHGRPVLTLVVLDVDAELTLEGEMVRERLTLQDRS